MDEAFALEESGLNQKLWELEMEHHSDELEDCYNADGVIAFVKPVDCTVDELKQRANEVYPSWAYINRLDKLVSGCLVGGLTQKARSSLHLCITNRSCMKVYFALIEHSPTFPESTLIDRPLKCKTFGKPVIQECQTYVETIWCNELIRCVLCYPITGRMHQIRRHLAMNDSQIISIDLPKQVFLYLHAFMYQFDEVFIQTPRPAWVCHVTDLDARISKFVKNAARVRDSITASACRATVA